MLWKQESIEKDALLIDIFKNFKYSDKLCGNNKKNNKLSVNARETGNVKLEQNDIDSAMKMYNKSIRFAEDNDHLCLAYGNRSYCFLKLNCFDQCLVDIQNAIDTHYPKHLTPKLEKRKKQCLEKLESQTKLTCIEPQLSYTPDHKLPCMANVLQIEINKQYGRLITAKTDIRIGETLLVEKAYVRSSTGAECYNCSKKNMNFFPCLNCADVMYCSKNCSDENFHSVECNTEFGSDDSSEGESSSFILRSLVIGINTFKTIDEMIALITSCLSTDPKEICQSISTPMEMYKAFFELSSFIRDQQILDFRKQAAVIFNTIMGSSKLSLKFDTQAKQRFLGHLIVHHGLIIRTNAFGGLCEPADEFNDDDVNGKALSRTEIDNDYERNVFLLTSYFNHSCLPNVTKLSIDNLAVVQAIQPIKKGQQLFVTYLAGELIKRTSIDRNDELEKGYGFRCNCDLCTYGVQKDSLILEMDTDFQYVINNVKFFRNLIQEIKDCCIRFLLNYPDKVASEPGYYILNTLVSMLQKQLVH